MCLNSYAEIKIIETDSTYIMGDNDSKVDARRIATQEAKRKALEQAGTFVASLTEVKEYRLTKDEVTAYTAGVVETEILSEDLKYPSITVKTRCKIDTGVLMEQIDRYRDNEELRQQLEASAKESEALKKERDELQKQLAAEKDKAKTEETRKKLDAVLTSEESLDDTNRIWAAVSRDADISDPEAQTITITQENLDKYSASLQRAVQVNPKNQRARILLASLYQKKGDRAAVENQLRAALERDPYNPLFHMRLGGVLRDRGKYDEALREFRVIEQKRPHEPHMLFQIGMTYKAKGNCKLAAAYLKRFMMYTKRNDKADISKMKPKAIQILKDCGEQPPQGREVRQMPMRHMR